MEMMEISMYNRTDFSGAGRGWVEGKSHWSTPPTGGPENIRRVPSFRPRLTPRKKKILNYFFIDENESSIRKKVKVERAALDESESGFSKKGKCFESGKKGRKSFPARGGDGNPRCTPEPNHPLLGERGGWISFNLLSSKPRSHNLFYLFPVHNLFITIYPNEYGPGDGFIYRRVVREFFPLTDRRCRKKVWILFIQYRRFYDTEPKNFHVAPFAPCIEVSRTFTPEDPCSNTLHSRNSEPHRPDFF